MKSVTRCVVITEVKEKVYENEHLCFQEILGIISNTKPEYCFRFMLRNSKTNAMKPLLGGAWITNIDVAERLIRKMKKLRCFEDVTASSVPQSPMM